MALASVDHLETTMVASLGPQTVQTKVGHLEMMTRMGSSWVQMKAELTNLAVH